MSKKPTLIAYTVNERGDGLTVKPSGRVSAPPSRTAFTLQLDTLPLDGRIVLTEPKDEEGYSMSPLFAPAQLHGVRSVRP